MIRAYTNNTYLSVFLSALITLSLQLIVTQSTHSATVYKKLDENGNLVFSDAPFEGAEAIEVKPVPTIDLSLPKSLSTTPPAAATPSPALSYQSLSITSPKSDSSLVNTGGAGTVNISSTPGLQAGHQYKLLINGELKGTQSSSSFSLTGLLRGAYTAVAQIVKDNGEVIKVSSPVTFYVRQHSIRH